MKIKLKNWFRYRPTSPNSSQPSRRPLAVEALDERCLLSADPVGLSYHTLAVERAPLNAQALATVPEPSQYSAAETVITLNLTAEGTTVALPTEPISLTFNTSGSSGSLLYAIDWDGDSVHEIVQLGGPSLSLSFAGFPDVGLHAVHAFVFDTNTGQVAEISHFVDVQPWRLAPNTYNPFLTDLYFSASDADDFLLILPGTAFEPSATPDVVVILDLTGSSGGLQVFAGITGVVNVYALSGNDTVFADLSIYGMPTLPQSVVMYGGSGNDFLVGSVNVDLLDGGDGNDILIGGLALTDGGDFLFGQAGHDLVFGGSGADYLLGGTGHDLLMTGVVNTGLSNWSTTLQQVRNEWVPFGVSGVEDGGSFVLGTTVLDDTYIDLLDGGPNTDWFIRDWGEDVIVDASTSSDVITDF